MSLIIKKLIYILSSRNYFIGWAECTLADQVVEDPYFGRAVDDYAGLIPPAESLVVSGSTVIIVISVLLTLSAVIASSIL